MNLWHRIHPSSFKRRLRIRWSSELQRCKSKTKYPNERSVKRWKVSRKTCHWLGKAWSSKFLMPNWSRGFLKATISPAETCLGKSTALWCSDAGFLLRAGNRLFLPAVQVNVTGCFTEIFTEIIPRMFVWSKVKSHCVYGKILLSSSNQCCEDI